MGNAFARLQSRINEREASRVAATSSADPTMVKRLPSNCYRGAKPEGIYEQGVLDGLHGKDPNQGAEQDKQLFGAYLDGVKAGNRVRLLQARKKEEAQRERAVPVRPIPTEAEVAMELADRETVDEARKLRRQNSGLIDELNASA
jgi:hypothetical protein